jgi:hypothetical protein
VEQRIVCAGGSKTFCRVLECDQRYDHFHQAFHSTGALFGRTEKKIMLEHAQAGYKNAATRRKRHCSWIIGPLTLVRLSKDTGVNGRRNHLTMSSNGVMVGVPSRCRVSKTLGGLFSNDELLPDIADKAAGKLLFCRERRGWSYCFTCNHPDL